MPEQIRRRKTRSNLEKRDSRRPLAYRTKKGKRVWLYAQFTGEPVEVHDSWQEINDLPHWVADVLSERPRRYRTPSHTSGFALLVNGRRHQYLRWEFYDFGQNRRDRARHYVVYYRRQLK